MVIFLKNNNAIGFRKKLLFVKILFLHGLSGGSEGHCRVARDFSEVIVNTIKFGINNIVFYTYIFDKIFFLNKLVMLIVKLDGLH